MESKEIEMKVRRSYNLKEISQFGIEEISHEDNADDRN
jgi:hypothetical protein